MRCRVSNDYYLSGKHIEHQTPFTRTLWEFYLSLYFNLDRFCAKWKINKSFQLCVWRTQIHHLKRKHVRHLMTRTKQERINLQKKTKTKKYEKNAWMIQISVRQSVVLLRWMKINIYIFWIICEIRRLAFERKTLTVSLTLPCTASREFDPHFRIGPIKILIIIYCHLPRLKLQLNS